MSTSPLAPRSAAVHAESPVVVPLDQARGAAGLAVDAATLGLEGLQLLEGLLRGIRALDKASPAGAIADAGALLVDYYIGPLQGMREDAEGLAAQLAALRQGTGGAA